MRPEVENKNKNCEYHGDYVGGDQIKNIVMPQEGERDFIVTHNAEIKPVAYFTGRETELQELRQRVEEKRKSVLVSGMGGIGKTQICRKLFDEYIVGHKDGEKGSFKHIGYIEYNGDMNSSLRKCLEFKQQDNHEQDMEAAWAELKHLASGGELLLFVDNVNKTIWDDAGLQRLSQIPGAVVLTSRQELFSDEFENYRIGFLSLEQCKEIYWKICVKYNEEKDKPEVVSDLEYIIEELAGRHTITVKFLARLANTKPWPVKKLREKLQQKGFCLEFKENGKIVNIQKSYEVLYDLSELTKAEQNILEAFSVFPYIPLFAETCNQWLLADAGAKEEDDVIAGLQQKGWLQFEAGQEGYTLHPVFAQFIYEKCKPKVEDHHGLLMACQNCIDIPQNGSALKSKAYIPFAESIAEKFEMDEGTVLFMMVLAFILQHTAEYEKAEELYKKILRITEPVLGEEHWYNAACYNNLAEVYKKQGEYIKAKEFYEKSLRITKQTLGEERPATAVCYNNLAEIYGRQGQDGKAKELYEKSLRIMEQTLGEEHPTTAICYNNLAGVYKKQGEYEKAKELYKKSLRITEGLSGGEHLYTAMAYNNLAGVYEKQGEYEKAKELYEKSRQIVESVLGEEHPETAACYSNLAIVYGKQGEYGKAKELHDKSLRIMERLLGEEHPTTAICYRNLADVYADQGEYEKAKELYEKSLRITEQVLGEEHPDIAMCYNNFAVVYAEQGEYEIAITYSLKAYSILLTKMGIDHPDTQLLYNILQTIYLRWNTKGNFDQWLSEALKK